MLNFIRPPICVTWPVPLHSGHCMTPPVCGLAVAGGAGLVAIDLDARLAAADGGPEVDGGLVFEIGAGLRPARPLRLLRAGEDAGEDVFEAAPGVRARARPAARLMPGPPWKPEKSKPSKSTGRAGRPRLLARIGLGLAGSIWSE